MAKIQKLINNGEVIYPITVLDAIYDVNNDKFIDKVNKIDYKADKQYVDQELGLKVDQEYLDILIEKINEILITING